MRGRSASASTPPDLASRGGEAAALPPPRRRAGRLPRGGHRAAAGAAALRAALPTASGSRSSRSSRDRFRLVLPDLPLHGDSEDRPRHPYTPEWLAEVMAGFCRETCGPRPLVGGHEARRAARCCARSRRGSCSPARLVLMPNATAPPRRSARRSSALAGWRSRAAAVPGLDRVVSHAAPARVPARRSGEQLTARGNPAARDLVRHAFDGRRRQRATARARGRRAARRWPTGAQSDLLDAYRADRASRRCCCGPTRTACTRSRSPRRRSTCCPTRSCACSAGPGS